MKWYNETISFVSFLQLPAVSIEALRILFSNQHFNWNAFKNVRITTKYNATECLKCNLVTDMFSFYHHISIRPRGLSFLQAHFKSTCKMIKITNVLILTNLYVLRIEACLSSLCLKTITRLNLLLFSKITFSKVS